MRLDRGGDAYWLAAGVGIPGIVNPCGMGIAVGKAAGRAAGMAGKALGRGSAGILLGMAGKADGIARGKGATAAALGCPVCLPSTSREAPGLEGVASVGAATCACCWACCCAA